MDHVGIEKFRLSLCDGRPKKAEEDEAGKKAGNFLGYQPGY